MNKALFAFLVLSIAACSSDDAPDDSASAAAACKRERDFISTHQTCSTHSDCTIVGSCSGGFGFEAVQVSARAEAQSYSDSTSCGKVWDGPTFDAVCETGRCVKRDRGLFCGAPRPIDGGSLLDASTDARAGDGGQSDGGT